MHASLVFHIVDHVRVQARSALAFSVCILCAMSACEAAGPAAAVGGVTEWVGTVQGPLKTRVYRTSSTGLAPVLVVVLHGDVTDPPPSYQYQFAQALTEGYDAVAPMSVEERSRLGYPSLEFTNLIAVGVLRPGFVDSAGDRSSGTVGSATGEPQYTAAVVDTVADALQRLKAEHRARALIVVGHSGGAAIAADVMGRHPGVVDGALLVACGCDPAAWRSRAFAKDHDPKWLEPDLSLSPLDLAARVPPGVRIRMVVGSQDDNAAAEDTTAFASALTAHGVDATVRVLPGLGHNIMFAAPVFEAMLGLLREFGVQSTR